MPNGCPRSYRAAFAIVLSIRVPRYPITQFTFQAADLSKMQLAKATGTLDDKSTEDAFATTVPEGGEGPGGFGGGPTGRGRTRGAGLTAAEFSGVAWISP